MLLSDADIKDALKGTLQAPWSALVPRGMDAYGHAPMACLNIAPFEPDHLNPSSYDVTLAADIRVPNPLVTRLDCRAIEPGYTDPVTIDPDGGYVLEPGDFIIATTAEYFTLPPLLAARCEGKSSIGRIGLAVHCTAGFIDPGFSGQVTLEIANLSPWEIVLRSGMRIAQMAFELMASGPMRPYGMAGGHYQGQVGPTESRYRMEP
jgi:dCTP deaminase